MQPPVTDDPAASPRPCTRVGCQGQQRVALVGASVRAAAESAARAGFCVVGIDLFGDTDTREACHQHFIVTDPSAAAIDACRQMQVIAVGGLHHNHPLLRPTEAQRRLREMGFLRKIAAIAGVLFPTTIEMPANESTSQRDEGRWLVKDIDSCGGLGVRWMTDPHERSGICQQWIPGRPFGATLLSDGRNVALLGICRSLFTKMQDRPFVYCGSVGPVELAPPVRDAILFVAQQIVDSTGMRGLLNVDFQLDRTGKPWLLEVNPRWSGSSELIERSLIDQRITDSLFGMLTESLEGPLRPALLTVTPPTPSESTYLKRIVFARRRLRFERSAVDPLFGPNESIHDVPVDGTLIQTGEPICTVITRLRGETKNPALRHRVLLRQIDQSLVEDR